MPDPQVPAPDRFPPVPDELVKALDRLFPERSPDPKDDDRAIWMKVGQRDVVRLLLAKQKQQLERATRSAVHV